MNQPDPGKRAQHLRSSLMQGSRKNASGAESAGSDGSGPLDPEEVLSPLDDIVQRMPPEEVGDPEQFRKALETLLTHAKPAVGKLVSKHDAELTGDELASAEAVIIQNGSRPSLLLREGRFAPDHPFLGVWKEDLETFQALPDIAARVGRIQVPGGNAADFHGTGTLVDAGKGLVLTNYHVVNFARDQCGVEMEGSGQTLRVKGDWVIDFVGESGTTKRNRWRIVEVRLPEGVGESFDGLDAAVLRIAPFSTESKEVTAALPLVLSGSANYAIGAGNAKLATIGFPGAPEEVDPPGATVNWNFVVKTLFNDLFGLKRVAPGRFLRGVGDVEDDKLGHILSHDATTFGGASGSLLFAFKNDGTPAFGLHFAGATLTANYAVSLHKAADALRKIGLSITD